jgi:ATP-dependent RNA helicase DDX10/DBP4
VPEDVSTYVHRVGRTARYKAKGNALLFLMPSEEAFLSQLNTRSVEMKRLGSKAKA